MTEKPEIFVSDHDGIIWSEGDWSGKRALFRRDGLVVIADSDGNFQSLHRDKTLETNLPQNELDDSIRGINDRLKVTAFIDANLPSHTTIKNKPAGDATIDMKPIEGAKILCSIPRIALAEEKDGRRKIMISFNAEKVGLGSRAFWFSEGLTAMVGSSSELILSNLNGNLTANYSSNLLNMEGFVHIGSRRDYIAPKLIRFLRTLPDNVQDEIKQHLELDDNYECSTSE